MDHYVFVYGTLRKHEGNHYLMKDAKFVAEQAWTNGLLYDTGLGYPAVKESKMGKVYGELYLVTDAQLQKLDVLEGYNPEGNNNLYNRKLQTIFHDTGSTEAFLYTIAKQNESMLKKHLSTGDWKLKGFHDKKQTLLYFAFGSCMDDKRFQVDGVDHYFQNLAGVGILKNYTLRFTRKSSFDGLGRADIVEDGGKVEGKVYELPIVALKEYLYAREGAPKAYRPTFVTIQIDGKKVEALTFVVTNKKKETPPPDWYEEEILRGAHSFLSDNYIANIQRHINSLKKSSNGGM